MAWHRRPGQVTGGAPSGAPPRGAPAQPDGRTATEDHEAARPGGASQPRPEPREPADLQPSDAELLRRHVHGDPDSFGELFLRHRDRLWAVAVRTLGDPEEAADALQDAMISAFRRAGSFRGDSAVTTWLHRIVINASLDRLRRKAARPVTSTPDEQVLDGLAMGHADLDPAADSDISLDVTAALRRLPHDQQAALVLVDMLGYPVADAAEILGVSQGTVKSRCARGRARLLPLLAHLRKGADSARSGPGPGQHNTPGQHSGPGPGQHSTPGWPGPAGHHGAPMPGQAQGNRSAAGNVLPAQEGGDPS
jgi:RNA polymerase sigma-70 factor (ECF subfamily)